MIIPSQDIYLVRSLPAFLESEQEIAKGVANAFVNLPAMIENDPDFTVTAMADDIIVRGADPVVGNVQNSSFQNAVCVLQFLHRVGCQRAFSDQYPILGFWKQKVCVCVVFNCFSILIIWNSANSGMARVEDISRIV